AGIDGLCDGDEAAERQRGALWRQDRKMSQRVEPGVYPGLAVGIDVDLVVFQKKFVDESTVGQGRHRVAEIFRRQAKFGCALPVWSQLHQRLGEGQGGRLSLDVRLLEDFLG